MISHLAGCSPNLSIFLLGLILSVGILCFISAQTAGQNLMP